MTNATSRVRRRTARLVIVAAVAAVITAGGSLVGFAVHQDLRRHSAVSGQTTKRQQVDRRAAAEAHAARPHQRGAGGSPRPGSVGGSTPPLAGPVSTISGPGATLVVPALGVRAPILATGAVNGSMTIPSDIHTVGWYDGLDATSNHPSLASAEPTAPFPGQPGVALLAGHVDWAGQGPGALYYLDQLRTGDPIEVVGSNRAVTHWVVSRAPITLSKSALPAALFANTGPARLALVTCGGPFDSATGHYLDNVIVWATAA